MRRRERPRGGLVVWTRKRSSAGAFMRGRHCHLPQLNRPLEYAKIQPVVVVAEELVHERDRLVAEAIVSEHAAAIGLADRPQLVVVLAVDDEALVDQFALIQGQMQPDAALIRRHELCDGDQSRVHVRGGVGGAEALLRAGRGKAGVARYDERRQVRRGGRL